MFEIHSGPFHPTLEDALCAVIRRAKTTPFSALAIVAPSARLRDRAQMLLAERGVAALNLHFHTIMSFAEELAAGAGDLPAIVSDPLFFDTLVKQILKDDRPFDNLDDLAVPDGFPPSVRSTLRDLIDAGVDDEKLLDAVNQHEEFNIPEVDAGSLKQLINLYRLYLSRMKTLGVSSRSRVLQAAATSAPDSVFLKGFSAVLFYGFYDLTGLQVELVDSVARHHNTHFFFPYLRGHPDHVFGDRFRGDVLDKIPHNETVLAQAEAPFFTLRGPAELQDAGPGALPRAAVWGETQARVVNVSGLRDEAWTIATEILRLHDEGTPFSDICVVARMRERLSRFAEVFEERQIPYVTSWKRTMSEMPQVEVGLTLLKHVSGAAAARDMGGSPDITLVLTAAVSPWPAYAPWTDSVTRAVEALDLHVKATSEEGRRGWAELRTAALTLRDFDRLGEKVSVADFLDALRDRWTTWPASVERGGIGVSVLHAEAARGLPFDTVFLAGLEERVFPRVIREDPFLRDSTRHAIVQTIGNKIGEKMLALAEERLLLYLLVNAARRRVYLTYQRSDDEGKIVGASSFLRKLVDEWQVPFDDLVNVVPRRLSGKIASAPAATLGRRDVLSGLLMEGRPDDAARFAAAAGGDGAALEKSVKALRSLESWDSPGAFDALVGSEAGGAHLDAQGMSPSGLESFARCPFQYFVRRVLRLAPIEEPDTLDRIADDVRGTVVHGFLEVFYQRCLETFGKTWPATPPEKIYDEVFDAHFAKPPAEIYPLLWTSIKRGLRDRIFRLIQADFSALSDRGLAPTFFEQKHQTTTLAPALDGTRFQGIMDRVDVGEKSARVVDYKTGNKRKGKMTTSVVKGDKAQPSLYLLMAAEFLKSKGLSITDVDFAYLYLNEDDPLVELNAADWATIRTDTIDSIRSQITMLSDGKFPIVPGRHCDWCDAATICRKTDSISAFRIAPVADELQSFKGKKAKGAL